MTTLTRRDTKEAIRSLSTAVGKLDWVEKRISNIEEKLIKECTGILDVSDDLVEVKLTINRAILDIEENINLLESNINERSMTA